MAENGRPVRLQGSKTRAVLTMLLLRPNELVSAERLAHGLWCDHPPDSAKNLLHGYISQLRKAIGSGFITTRSRGYVLNVAPEAIDACRFERLVEAGGAALKESQPDLALDLLEQALSLWRGDPFADFTSLSFAIEEAERLHELRLHAYEQAFEAELALGRHAEVVGRLHSIADAHPLRERLWAQLILALYRCGRQGDALRAFSELRHNLVEELGVDPSVALRQLETDVLQQRPDLDWHAPAGPASKTSLHPLPSYRSTFVGRQGESDELRDLLATERLLTVIGPAGVGKTRLALEVARRVEPEYEYRTMVELAPLAEPALVADAVANALCLPDMPDRSLGERLRDTLGRRSVLIVLDNCEHVIAAAAQVIDTVLRAVPGATVLATSREALRLEGERVWRTPPLAVPDSKDAAGTLATVEAVRLFVSRAGALGTFALRPDNANAVAQLCCRLDGLPLAIELAAARTPALTPQEIVDQLDEGVALLNLGHRNAPARHQTLRAAMDWSYRALPEQEVNLFRRLSVFRGGFTLPAACYVAVGEDADMTAVAEVLATLVDKSLLSVDQWGGKTRYRMLETIRSYAAERLLEADEARAVRCRHLQWYLDFLEHSPAFLGASRDDGLDPLGDERDNVRSALQTAIDQDDITSALHIIHAGGFVAVSEGWVWAEKVVAASVDAGPRLRAEAMLVQGSVSSARGDHKAGIAARQAALSLFQELDDDLGAAVSLHYLGAAAALQRNYDEALRLYRLSIDAWDRSKVLEGYGTGFNFVLHNLAVIALEIDDLASARTHLTGALAVAHDLEEQGGVAVHTYGLGELYEAAGNVEDAARAYNESLAIARSIHFPRYSAKNLSALARLDLMRGDFQASATLLLEALALSLDDHDRPGVARALLGLAACTAAAGDRERAAAFVGASDRLQEEMGVPRPRLERELYDRTTTDIRSGIDGEDYDEAFCVGRRWTVGDIVREGRSIAAVPGNLPHGRGMSCACCA